MSNGTSKEKKRLGLVPSYATCLLALMMPGRLRVIFTFALNFIYNSILDSLKIVLSAINNVIVGVLIFLTYFIIVGFCSLIAKFLKYDSLSQDPRRPSYFLDREKALDSLERSSRQY